MKGEDKMQILTVLMFVTISYLVVCDVVRIIASSKLDRTQLPTEKPYYKEMAAFINRTELESFTNPFYFRMHLLSPLIASKNALMIISNKIKSKGRI